MSSGLNNARNHKGNSRNRLGRPPRGSAKLPDRTKLAQMIRQQAIARRAARALQTSEIRIWLRVPILEWGELWRSRQA
jgi:hypothetical protein